jgi:phosphatidate cytidylyltransferase
MLRWRLLLGVVLTAALVGLLGLEWWLARPGVVLLPLALVAGALGAGELIAMLRARGHQPSSRVIYGGTLLAILVASAPALPYSVAFVAQIGAIGLFAMVFALSLLLAVVGEMRRYDGSGRATTNIALTMLAILYVGGLLSFLVQLRLLGGEKDVFGLFALASMMAVVKMSDIGQYTAGRLFGRHKLAPQISPGKTWEGLAGGLLFACVTACLLIEPVVSNHVLSATGVARAVVYATALAAAGLIGDLTESMFKRDAGVKDSSTWLPGFGGVLDLLDSLLGAAPLGYLFWVMGWIGR